MMKRFLFLSLVDALWAACSNLIAQQTNSGKALLPHPESSGGNGFRLNLLDANRHGTVF
jgi:hypothetical protein